MHEKELLQTVLSSDSTTRLPVPPTLCIPVFQFLTLDFLYRIEGRISFKFGISRWSRRRRPPELNLNWILWWAVAQNLKDPGITLPRPRSTRVSGWKNENKERRGLPCVRDALQRGRTTKENSPACTSSSCVCKQRRGECAYAHTSNLQRNFS